MTERTVEEHLAWCKQRALEYLDRGDLPNAVMSMASDLKKHPKTARQNNRSIMALGMILAAHKDIAGLRQWIEGFQ